MVRRSTPAMTSLEAKVCRLQCHGSSLTPEASIAGSNAEPVIIDHESADEDVRLILFGDRDINRRACPHRREACDGS